MIYQDGIYGPAFAKRFAVTGVTRDKEYNLTKGTKGTKVFYFTANPNGEAETVRISLKPKPKLRKPVFEYNFSDLAIKGRNSIGNIITKHQLKKVVLKDEGVSTLGARNIWYDETVMRLNTENRGKYLGAFKSDDKIITIYKSGYYRLMSYDLSNHFEEDLLIIEKFYPDKIVNAVYYDGEKQQYYVKRFQIEETVKKQDFIGDNPDSFVYSVSMGYEPKLEIVFDAEKNKKHFENEIVLMSEFIAVKGIKAKGKRLSNHFIKEVIFHETVNENENIDLSPEIEEETIEKNDTRIDFEGNEPIQMTLF